MNSTQVILVKRRYRGWNYIFCKFVWALLVPIYLLAAIWLIGTYGPGSVAKLASPIMQQFGAIDLFPIYLTFACLAVTAFALQFCLHDLVTKDGGESVIVADDHIERRAKSSILSVITTPTPGSGNVYLPTWNLDRSTIRKMVVRVHDKLDSSTLQIYHDKGIVWLRLTEWKYKSASGSSEEVFATLARLNRKLSPDELQQLPLLKEAMARNYPVEFQWKNSGTFER